MNEIESRIVAVREAIGLAVDTCGGITETKKVCDMASTCSSFFNLPNEDVITL